MIKAYIKYRTFSIVQLCNSEEHTFIEELISGWDHLK